MLSTLAERYRIERELGAGGMATVYLAEDLRHQRRVAIKVVRSELAAGMGAELFLREIQLAARLNHPNILPLYDSGDADGELYYVMPVAEGESLRDRLDREGHLPVADAVRLAGEVADALGYAHRHEVVHRDIKPENILLHEGHAVITDFGIGKALSTAATGATLTQLGLAIGTPAYMSPEQAGGEPNLDGRTDLYSLGCVLYEMLAGAPPFTGATVPAVIAKRFTEAPPDLTAARASVPRAVADVVRRLMAVDPAQRFATAAQAAAALARSLTPGAAFEPGSGPHRIGSRLPWVAVLSFQSRDAELADFAEGLAEDITTGLSRFSHLQVVAYQSSKRFGSQGADLKRIGEELGARYLVEGSIRKAGAVIRLSAQLVDAASGTHLWAETFDRDLGATNIFALQDELTDRIVATVADPFGVLVRVMARPLLEKPVEELTASELCIRLYAHNQQLRPEEHAQLRRGLELALERESNHVDAWAALATVYWTERMHGLNPLPDPLGRAMRAAQRAVQLDPTSQTAWEALAEAQYFSGDLNGSRQSAERTIALNHRNTASVAVMAMLIAFGGEWERGYAIMQRVMAINPHHAGWFHFVPLHYHFKRGEYEEALAAAKRINMPDFPWTYSSTAMVCAELGRWDEAAAAVEEATRRFPQLDLVHQFGNLQSGWFHDRDLEEREAQAWRKAVAGPPTQEPAAPQPQSIAVLPFTNLSPDADDAYFADGITEEIINVLAQLPGLRVAARTSCFAFKGKHEDLRLVGEKLGVQHVLEGSVRKSGPKLRITAQLIGVADGFHLWSERYDRELVDIFALQDEIANAIAAKLRLSLVPGPAGGAGRAGPRNVEAYELLLKGRVLLGQRGRAILDALPCLERAVALDPELVEAHALLADAYRVKWIYGMAPAGETVPRALAAIESALALDPDNEQALATLANIRIVHDLDVAGSLALTDRVLARNPHHVQALCERADWQAIRTDSPPEPPAQLLRYLRTAREADPLNAWAAAMESLFHGCTGRYEDALRNARQAFALDPNAFTGRWALVWALSWLGKYDEALAGAEETLHMSGRNPRILAEIATIHARRGENGAVQQILEELRGRAASSFIESSVLGCVAAAAGLMEEARALVARGIAEHEVYWQLGKATAWAPFRADPEGDRMLRGLGF